MVYNTVHVVLSNGLVITYKLARSIDGYMSATGANFCHMPHIYAFCSHDSSPAYNITSNAFRAYIAQVCKSLQTFDTLS